MMSIAADDPVKLRLRACKTNDQWESAASFVARYFHEIQVARHEGKSWDEIGRDLRPDSPIKGDTVRKSIARAEKRAGPKAKSKRVTVSKGSKPRFENPETQPESQAQLDLGMAVTEPKRTGLFSRRVDPIRVDK